jgi:amino acid transporter
MFTIPKLLALIVIIILGIVSKKGTSAHFYSTPVICDKRVFLSFGLALIPILWTYGGWHENTFVAEETKNAHKTIPAALFIGISVVTMLYLAINFVYVLLVPITEMAHSDLIVVNVLQTLCGVHGKKIFEAFVIISSLGCMNAMIMTGSRVTYAMAKDNIIFRYIGEVNNKYDTPLRSIIVNAVWSIVLIILGTFNQLLFFTGLIVWLFFALAVGGLFILRNKYPDIERPYKVWLYPYTPAVFILICIALFMSTLISYPFQSFLGLCILMSGIPVFILSQMKKSFTRQ